MNWSAIGAVGETLGAIAVLATLLYLAIQVKQLKKGIQLGAVQDIVRSFNDFLSMMSSSESLSEILVRGRNSYTALTPEEQVRFDHIYFYMMNIIESWHFQVNQTMDPGPLRDEHIRNFGVAILMYCDFPGAAEFWHKNAHAYNPETRKLFENNTGSA